MSTGLPMRRHRILRRLPALLLLAAACAINPATGERELNFFSESEEIAIGREADPEIVAEMGLYPDPALQEYVQELGARLAARSERPGLPWTFRVLDDPVVNAFALPGGFIYVTRGLLAHLDSEAELASVIGHEIGHVTARHGSHQMSTQILARIGLGAAAVLFPKFEPYADAAGTAFGLLFLKYGRDDEREADDLGLRYMRRTGYDPAEAPDVFTMLEDVSRAEGGDEGDIPEWLSTHPDPGDRRERLLRQVATLPPDSVGDVVRREEYLRRLDGLIFGENPREGYFDGAEFLHPEMRFRLRFPAGWETYNSKQAVQAVAPREDAVIELTLADQPSAIAAARAFAAEEGVQPGIADRGAVNGLPAATLEFAAALEDGTALRGVAAFVEHHDAVFQVLAFAEARRWRAYEDDALETVESFRPLRDRRALAVQPLRLEIVRIQRELSFEQFARRYAGPVPDETLALLNRAGPGARFPAGTLLRRVVGDPPPRRAASE